MIFVLDNYDSFTYNLVQLLGELGAELEVERNDQVTVSEIESRAPEALVLSPGPGRPADAGILIETVRHFAGKVPILGVCLGHQAIGEAFGGRVVRANVPMHGKVSQIIHQGAGVFAGLPSPFTGTRYHSLTVERETFPDVLEITAESEDGLIMGLQHRTLPVHGVQFHPESIASEHGHLMLKNFLDLAAAWNAANDRRSGAAVARKLAHKSPEYLAG